MNDLPESQVQIQKEANTTCDSQIREQNSDLGQSNHKELDQSLTEANFTRVIINQKCDLMRHASGRTFKQTHTHGTRLFEIHRGQFRYRQITQKIPQDTRLMYEGSNEERRKL